MASNGGHGRRRRSAAGAGTESATGARRGCAEGSDVFLGWGWRGGTAEGSSGRVDFRVETRQGGVQSNGEEGWIP